MIHFTNINGERLPEDVNKIANERCTYSEQDFDGIFDIRGAFYFIKQIEGYDIWWQVSQGNYEPFRKFHNL